MRSRKVTVPRSAGGVGCQLAIAAGEAGNAAHLAVAAGDASSTLCVPKGPGNRVTQRWSALYPFVQVKSEFRRVRGASIEPMTFKVEWPFQGAWQVRRQCGICAAPDGSTGRVIKRYTPARRKSA
jgi:hypothetical protein